jgi:hypothetical protein
MRRIALVLLAMTGAAAAEGCRASRPAPAGPPAAVRAPQGEPTTDPEATPSPSPFTPFSRKAVPDSVMLRNQAESGYRDTPVP